MVFYPFLRNKCPCKTRKTNFYLINICISLSPPPHSQKYLGQIHIGWYITLKVINRRNKPNAHEIAMSPLFKKQPIEFLNIEGIVHSSILKFNGLSCQIQTTQRLPIRSVFSTLYSLDLSKRLYHSIGWCNSIIPTKIQQSIKIINLDGRESSPLRLSCPVTLGHQFAKTCLNCRILLTGL